MMITDMCLPYRNNEEYFKCMTAVEDNSLDNIHGWKQHRWECAVPLLYVTAKDLYPQDRNCCAWTKHVTIAGQSAVSWDPEKPVDFCGI